MATVILRLPVVKARTGLSRSTIYLRISEGRFPVQIGFTHGLSIGFGVFDYGRRCTCHVYGLRGSAAHFTLPKLLNQNCHHLGGMTLRQRFTRPASANA